MKNANSEGRDCGKVPYDGFAQPLPLRGGPKERSEISDKIDDESSGDSKEVAPLTIDYEPPNWSGVPQVKIKFEVIKEGVTIDTIENIDKPHILIGRYPTNDWVLQHDSTSRAHAIIQFRSDGSAFLYDLNSTHGSFINKKRVEPRVHNVFYSGDILGFGSSSRIYVMTYDNGCPTRSTDEIDERPQLSIEEAEADLQSAAPLGLDTSKDISDKMTSEMLSEIKDLCSSLGQEFEINTQSVRQQNGGGILYHACAEVQIDSLIKDGEPIEVEMTSPSKKEAQRSVIAGIYSKLLSADAFSALKMRIKQQENFDIALRIHHEGNEGDDYYDRSTPNRKRITDYSNVMSSITIGKLLKDRDTLIKCIEEQRKVVNSAQKGIHSRSSVEEDEIDMILNNEIIKEAQTTISNSKKEILALEKELGELDKLIKKVSPSSLLQIPVEQKPGNNEKKHAPENGINSEPEILRKSKKTKSTVGSGADEDSEDRDELMAQEYKGISRRSMKYFNAHNTTNKTEPKLKLGLNVPEARAKSSRNSNTDRSNEGVEIRDKEKVRGPSRPPPELLEDLRNNAQDLYEDENEVDCVDLKGDEGTLESEIQDFNAMYGY